MSRVIARSEAPRRALCADVQEQACVCARKDLVLWGETIKRYPLDILITASDSPKCLSALLNHPLREIVWLRNSFSTVCALNPHTKNKTKITQLTDGLRFRTATLQQLITLESTGQKGVDVMKFFPTEAAFAEEI